MIGLSRRQIKEADRVGGIELMLPYPSALGGPPSIPEDTDREGTDAESAWVRECLRPVCQAHDLVPVHTRVACVHRPGEGYRVRLAVTIIGRRWVHARTHTVPRVMFASWDAHD